MHNPVGPPSSVDLGVSNVRRADRTRDKVLRGELPAPTAYTRTIGIGDGAPCEGCAETIQPTETLYIVRLLDLRELKFHEPCFTAWADVLGQ